MAISEKPRGARVQVSVRFSGRKDGDSIPEAMAYAFSTGGKLLARAGVGKDGRAELELGGVSGARILVGPAVEGTVDVAELARRGAQERHLRLAGDKLEAAFELTPDRWRIWGQLCLVKGTLQKRVERDGVTIDLPVCNAQVKIYEVDPLWIILPRIPKGILDRFRDIVLERIPVPDPDPGPMKVLSGAIPTQLKLAAASGNAQALQSAILAHVDISRFILCRLFPVTRQLLTTVTTDDCGHFHAWIWKSWFNPDQPDLYFEAWQNIGLFGNVKIYGPTPISCYTHWNYVCGTEVTLTTTHPLAITCAPCAPVAGVGDNWVLFMAVGNTALSLIQGVNDPAPAGQTGLTTTGAPWGGTLRPRVEFDNALRDSLGVHYYRLSWKRDTEPDNKYRPFTEAVARHYAHMVGTSLVLDAYPLGPVTVGAESGLVEIPPALPPLGQWSLPDVVLDTQSGAFSTTLADGSPILDGLIQIRLELFDSAGAAVDVAMLGIKYFVPTSTVLTGTVNTVAAPAWMKSGSALVLTLHVNNEPCSGAIAAPKIGTVAADDCCGVLRYGSSDDGVTLNWTATHPHGFATWTFGVVRGTADVFADDGDVAAAPFSTPLTVDYLLNHNLPTGCVEGGCKVAGFSENLHVYATATDGWSTQTQYNAGAVRAFVLSDH